MLMSQILNSRSVIFSGLIISISKIKRDKVDRENFTFCLGLKQNKRDLSKVWITSYKTNLLDEPWFRFKSFIHTESYWVNNSFYVLEQCSPNAYDCYKRLIERINKAFEDEENIS